MGEASRERFARLRPDRAVQGTSAVLLPYDDWHRPDWSSFDLLLARTVEAGLTPAVNTDHGYGTLLTPTEREWVLDRTRVVLGGAPFIAGAFLRDTPAKSFDLDGHLAAVAKVEEYGGTPLVYPSFGMQKLEEAELLTALDRIGEATTHFLFLELADGMHPFGVALSPQGFCGLLDVVACHGLVHRSLSRALEWQRLAGRDELRPDFRIYTANELAIDMPTFGSDYLLGLAAFAPDVFAERDRAWAAGDLSFYEHNDALQALGAFAFRDPFAAGSAQCAQFLKLRGWIPTDVTHRRANQRPSHDVSVLKVFAQRLGVF